MYKYGLRLQKNIGEFFKTRRYAQLVFSFREIRFAVLGKLQMKKAPCSQRSGVLVRFA